MVGNRILNPIVAPTRDPNRRLGFQDTDKEVVATRSVKLKNKAAEQKERDRTNREEYRQKFEENADKTIQYHDDKNKRAVDCVSRYLKMANDKTLIQNKGGIAEDVEREIRQELIQMALDLNNDENEEDNGKGSVAVLSVVTKIIMLYRDRLNQLEYEMHQLKRELQRRDSSSRPTPQTTNAEQ
jgi:hypothetical protein